jgi:hypothetical protein
MPDPAPKTDPAIEVSGIVMCPSCGQSVFVNNDEIQTHSPVDIRKSGFTCEGSGRIIGE